MGVNRGVSAQEKQIDNSSSAGLELGARAFQPRRAIEAIGNVKIYKLKNSTTSSGACSATNLELRGKRCCFHFKHKFTFESAPNR